MIWLKFTAVAVACALLAACASEETRDGPYFDAASWAAHDLTEADWDMRGRLAVSQGSEAGNASIRWSQRGQDFDIQLSAPITHQNWRLVSQGGHARLEGLEGGTRESDDAEALLLEATGWRLPVKGMSLWVRGSRGTVQEPENEEWDSHGRLAKMRREGWTIEYRDWFGGDVPLPRKVFARKDDASVRLVVESWEEK